MPTPPEIDISFIADPANTLENKHWFLISDLAGVVEMFTKNLSSLVLIGLVLIFGTTWALWKTRFGLRLRSCGESPSAAETLGVNVYRYKFVAVLISGAFAGLGGRDVSRWSPAPASRSARPTGRGYIGLAAMIFGNWRPVGMFLGSMLFGYTQALPFREGTVSLHGLLLLVDGDPARRWRSGPVPARGTVQALTTLVFGALFLVWFLLTDVVPREFTTMAPYVTTLLVLAFASQRLRMPAADGQIYRKGSAG